MIPVNKPFRDREPQPPRSSMPPAALVVIGIVLTGFGWASTDEGAEYGQLVIFIGLTLLVLGALALASSRGKGEPEE